MFFISMSDRHGDVKNLVNFNNEMVLAKEALITYAVNYADIYPASATNNLGPGRFPCPDIDMDGDPETSCEGGTELIYRLPISVQKPVAGDLFYFSNTYTEETGGVDFSQFWYAVSPDFSATNTPTYTLNSATDGLLELDGQNDYVAVIIAPDEPQIGQNRSSDSNRNDRANYLEAPNNSTATGIFSNYAAGTPTSFNDRVIGITRNELMSAVTMKVAIEIKRALENHYESYEAHPSSASYDYECLSGTHCYPRQDPAVSTPFCFWCLILNNPLPPPGDVPFYESVMQDAVDDSNMAEWYEDDDWDDVITYDNISDNEATLEFAECAITYTLRYNTEPEIERQILDDDGNEVHSAPLRC